MFAALAPLAKDFLNAIDFCPITASMHAYGHTLDLVSRVFTFCDLVVSNTYISDHVPIVFNLPHPATQHPLMLGQTLLCFLHTCFSV